VRRAWTPRRVRRSRRSRSRPATPRACPARRRYPGSRTDWRISGRERARPGRVRS
jgi:hypothetical protein